MSNHFEGEPLLLSWCQAPRTLPDFRSWQSPPYKTDNTSCHAVGCVGQSQKYQLISAACCPGKLENTRRMLKNCDYFICAFLSLMWSEISGRQAPWTNPDLRKITQNRCNSFIWKVMWWYCKVTVEYTNWSQAHMQTLTSLVREVPSQTNYAPVMCSCPKTCCINHIVYPIPNDFTLFYLRFVQK